MESFTDLSVSQYKNKIIKNKINTFLNFFLFLGLLSLLLLDISIIISINYYGEYIQLKNELQTSAFIFLIISQYYLKKIMGKKRAINNIICIIVVSVIIIFILHSYKNNDLCTNNFFFIFIFVFLFIYTICTIITVINHYNKYKKYVQDLKILNQIQ
jgi:hypothetical protein